jgi:UDP-2-acetamido-3-amino-2,3-dideoxy-glucuronate N-acetyltransferase
VSKRQFTQSENAQSLNGVQIHPSADVSPQAQIGEGTKVWHQAQVREGARIGHHCIIGKGAYIDSNVTIGNLVKIQNGAFVFHGATLEDGVFVGPHACLANDRLPRAITPDGRPKGDADWEVGHTLIQYGASVGSGAVILPGVNIGRWAMIGAGAVVTKDVAAHGLVVGNPARLIGYVCACGHRLTNLGAGSEDAPHGSRRFSCPFCRREYAWST